MSVFALIPWSDDYLLDEIFNKESYLNHDHILEPYYELKKEFEDKGHIIHTIDYYDDWKTIDYFLFFRLDWAIYKRIVLSGWTNKMVYCTAEPPSVYAYNSSKGYKLLKHIFPYILTWNDEWVDNKRIFKRITPYFFVDQRKGNLGYDEKKLVTIICSNKSSLYKGELYSERKRAIDFFEKNHKSEFDFYGNGWNENDHKCYRGKAKDKSDVYHKYKFAICYENIEGLKGYITEKIFDCLVSGIVPIYAGAPDIGLYIPEGSYIRLRDFSSYEELYEYLSSVTEERYVKYLECAGSIFSCKVTESFSGKKYAEYILQAIKSRNKVRMSFVWYKIFKRIKWK